MNSGGHRFFTVVTIITLVFAPFFSHHHWVYRLVGMTSETHKVQCVVHHPCPAQQVIVNVIAPPLPQDPPRGRGNHEDDEGDQHGQHDKKKEHDVQYDGNLSAALVP
jgi:hypothetical protein